MTETAVFVDAENVRRSQWPNISAAELVERCRTWARAEGVHAVVVFDGRAPAAETDPYLEVVGTGAESADEWISRVAADARAAGRRFRLVTSDRALRADAGRGAERVIGGGSFLGMLSTAISSSQIRRKSNA